MKLSFAARVFVTTFLPVALLLCASFAIVRSLVQDRIKENLRASLRQSHEFIGRIRAAYDVENNRMLSMIAGNASLEAGMELVRQHRRSDPGGFARKTLDAQLAEAVLPLGFDFAMTTDAGGTPTAGVIRTESGTEPIGLGGVAPRAGVTSIGLHTYHLASVPVGVGDEHLGDLFVGRLFEFNEFLVPAVLLKDGKVIRSNIGHSSTDIERALAACPADADCEFQLGKEHFLSLPIEKVQLGNGYTLRSLQSVDAAAAGLGGMIEKVFVGTGALTLITLALVAILSARSVVRPVTGLVGKLRESESAGMLVRFEISDGIREMDDLVRAFNRASDAVARAHGRLTLAHTEFIRTIANALDARDVYTAGHSFRVSEYACAIAEKMGLGPDRLEVVRVGALVHDVGKIGVPDQILRKAGPLTATEFEIIKRHATIGRRILENVEGFHAYLDVVEFHHENHDGSGYPRGLAGEAVPIEARIVHVADAYDAMTSDRPYRSGMGHEEASARIREHAGSQFDPAVAEAFLSLDPAALAAASEHATGDLARLAVAIEIRSAESLHGVRA